LKKIQVTSAIKPNALFFLFFVFKILRTNVFTNNGPRVRELEQKLQILWGVKHVVAMANGTLPLICISNTLKANGKIATTPFSFVATTSSIIETGHQPIFVDLDPQTYRSNISQLRNILETGNIDAILLTHTYGIQHEIESVIKLGSENGVKVFFDASHCFGVNFKGKSILTFGDASTISFHATKILSTIEGGALVTDSDDLANYARMWRNFGIHDGEIIGPGQNAKMSEIHALFGLLTLRKTAKDIQRRQILKAKYRKISEQLNLELLDSPNGAYMPLILPSESCLIEFIRILETKNIFPRRYFYPSLNQLSWLSHDTSVECPISSDLSSRIVCLPSGSDVNDRVISEILKALVQCLK
jgi:dTDP-4-amino-4,6-dideoxygalactose transaminase